MLDVLVEYDEREAVERGAHQSFVSGGLRDVRAGPTASTTYTPLPDAVIAAALNAKSPPSVVDASHDRNGSYSSDSFSTPPTTAGAVIYLKPWRTPEQREADCPGHPWITRNYGSTPVMVCANLRRREASRLLHRPSAVPSDGRVRVRDGEAREGYGRPQRGDGVERRERRLCSESEFRRPTGTIPLPELSGRAAV